MSKNFQVVGENVVLTCGEHVITTNKAMYDSKIDFSIETLLTGLKRADTKEKLGRFVIDPRAPNVQYPVVHYPMFDDAPAHPRFNEPYISFYDFFHPDIDLHIEAFVHYLREGWVESLYQGKIFAALKKAGYEITILEQPTGKPPTKYYVGTIKLKQGLLPF